jgi:signal transduction histidine kinase
MNERARPAWRSGVRPVAWAAVALLLLVTFTVGADGWSALVVPPVLGVTGLGVAGWAVRRTRAERAAYEARLTDWAAAEAVLSERLRVARDLHDIVSHGLGLITVRAAAVRHVTAAHRPGDLAEARQALADIETAGRDATAELRRMLTVLRTGDDPAAPRLPVDDLAQLPDIVRRGRVAGLRTALTVDDVGAVTPGAQVAVCRTVREALSNTARHAGPTDVRVHVYRDGPVVVVAVADAGPDGPWRAAPGAGHGLIGLRERVGGLGGELRAGPDEGGFRVTARIPDPAP